MKNPTLQAATFGALRTLVHCRSRLRSVFCHGWNVFCVSSRAALAKNCRGRFSPTVRWYFGDLFGGSVSLIDRHQNSGRSTSRESHGMSDCRQAVLLSAHRNGGEAADRAACAVWPDRASLGRSCRAGGFGGGGANSSGMKGHLAGVSSFEVLLNLICFDHFLWKIKGAADRWIDGHITIYNAYIFICIYNHPRVDRIRN